MKIKRVHFIFVLSLLLCVANLRAQTGTGSLENHEKAELIQIISGLLKDHYVFSELGEKFGKEILSISKSGKFDGVRDPKEFGEAVTSALQELTKDKHILFRLIEASDIGENREGSLHHPIRYYRLGQREHLGIFRLDWIDNEIGYMDYRRFYYHRQAKEMLMDAMEFLSPANAVIIDLRENGGGTGYLIPLLCSYFLPHPTQLTSTYYRQEDFTEEMWTLEKMEGKPLLDVPLFVLIGKNTFSAAEYLAYDLKVRKRAILVGESTKGGAHSVDLYPVGDKFEIYISTARAINPVTGKNWEGTGVMPDVEVSDESALDTAIGLAKEAAQKYGKAKEAIVREIVEEMQKGLDQAESLYQQGKEDEAKALLDAAFQTGTRGDLINEFFVDVLAYHYASLEAHEMTIGILKKKVELSPESASSYESLAWAYYRQGEKALATKYFGKALELDKNSSNAKQMLKKLKDS